MPVMYTIGVYSEDEPRYIGMNQDGELYWTTIPYHAMMIKDKPNQAAPPGCQYLPFYVPPTDNLE